MTEKRPIQEVLEAAALQMANPPKEPAPERSPEWVPSVYRIFTKVFDAQKFNPEKEKRIKVALGHAIDEEAALEAIDLIWNENVRYPMGGALREAVDRVNLRRWNQEPKVPGTDHSSYVPPEKGPFMSFREWYAAQDAEMQARVRRVFPSLKIHAEKAEHA